MKSVKYVAILSTLALLSPLGALARDKNQHSIEVSDPIQIGTTQLKPGNYKLQWQGDGPTVQVNFLQNGKTVAAAPATLKTDDNQVKQDEVVTDPGDANTRALREIDFVHQKEALIFSQGNM
jgi:hypothetical protein